MADNGYISARTLGMAGLSLRPLYGALVSLAHLDQNFWDTPPPETVVEHYPSFDPCSRLDSGRLLTCED